MTPDHPITRRTLLRSAAAGGTALIATGGLPAWARPTASLARGLRGPDSLPFPHLPAGHESMRKIRHVVVLMMENHSFDNILGMVPHEVPGRRHLDGLRRRHHQIVNYNFDATGARVYAAPAASPCQLPSKPSQAWNASHQSWDNGRNDGFVQASGPSAMWFWDEHDIPFTYSLAKHFPIGERYFCSVLAQTFPNRRFFFTGSASGTIDDVHGLSNPAPNGTIWDRFDAHGIDWAVYAEQLPSWVIVPGSYTKARASRNRGFSQFATDVAAGKLPQFTFVEPNYSTTSEENPQDIQVGEEFIASVVTTLMRAHTWKHTALFITYDEHGGYYDHVPPPPAIIPDSTPPMLSSGDYPGAYDRYGFRVPLLVVSPWARKHYVSRVTQDHTSLDAFIERKWNLPAMTMRDANAHPMTDYFDFTHPAFHKPPRLHRAPGLDPGLAECHAQGLNPPLPPGSGSSTDVARALAGDRAK